MPEKFKVRIVTPKRLFYEGEAGMVEMNTTEGQIGALPGHIPMTVLVAPGVLTITEDAEHVRTAALHSGFAEILPDSFTIMAEVIEWPDEIDEARAEAARKRAEERLDSHSPDIDMDRAEAALQRAVARISTLHERGM